MVGKSHACVLVRDWLGEQRLPDRAAALAELARRYLAGHGPATDRDLARWAGINVGDARKGLGAISSELRELDGGLVDLKKRSRVAELPPPRLLGAFDPVLLGWTSREDILGPHRHLVTVNGIFRPFAMAKGRAVGTWSMPKGEVELEALGRVSKADRAALERDAEDVKRFLG
jgi:winged helix DNA-binding protein